MASSLDENAYACMEAWRAKLVAAQRLSAFDIGSFYVPREEVHRITGPRYVHAAECELLGVEDTLEYSRLITGRQLLLCILIYVRLPHRMRSVCSLGPYGTGLTDHDLPLSLSITDDSSELSKHQSGIPVVGHLQEGRPLATEEVFPGWELSEICEFYEAQWRFLVPVFNWNTWGIDDTRDPIYHSRTVLPLECVEMIKTTPFSRVWKVKIQASHVNKMGWGGSYEIPPTEFLALKESFLSINNVNSSATVDEALNERAFYARQSWQLEVSSTHLNRCFGAFRRRNAFYMLLPFADGGSLGDLWQANEPAHFTASQLLRWMESNIAGLIRGLNHLHSMNCSHGDLKPDNILVFLDAAPSAHVSIEPGADHISTPADILSGPLGTLKISDFGTVRADSNATVARTRDVNALTGAQRYAPPEFDRNELEHNSPRSRLYDVWSLGCMLLEFVIWACCGAEGVRRFGRGLEMPHPARFWTYTERNKKTLHPSVKHQFRKLRRILGDAGRHTPWLDPNLRQYLLTLLGVIQNQMIVLDIDKTIPARPREFEDSCTDDDQDISQATQGGYRAYPQALIEEFVNPARGSMTSGF